MLLKSPCGVHRIRNLIARQRTEDYGQGVFMRRIVLAILALTVLLPSLAEARARWMTDVDLYVREACCCPPRKLATAPAPTMPTVQKVCCKLEKRAASPLPITAEVSAPAMPAAPVASFSFVPEIPPVRTIAAAITPRAQAPPDSTLLAQFRGLLL